MAKIYGTPIMAGGSGGMNKDLPPLLDNFKAFKGGGTSENPHITIQADKMATSRANELAGAVWVYADHEPTSVNDGTKIQLSRDEVVEGAPLSSLLSGSKIKFGRYNGQPLTWELGRDVETNEMFLVMDGTSMAVLGKHRYNNSNETTNFGLTTLCHWLNFEDGDDFLSEFTSVELSVMNTEDWSYGEGTIHSPVVTVPVNMIDSNTLDIFTSEEDWVVEIPEEPSGTSYWISAIDPALMGGFANRFDNDSAQISTAKWNYKHYVRPICAPNPSTPISGPDDEGYYTIGGEATVQKTVQWNNESDFFARQFTYNSKKQYQTMLEGAIATLVLTGVPDPVTELAEQHSGSSITLTWKNPTSDELYDHTVVVYKTDAFPTAIDDGTQGYSGTDETATLSGLKLGITYYIAVFTVSAYGLYGEPQTVQVEIPAGQLLSSLASGTKVKLGKWNNTDLQWKVARDTSDQSIRLVLEPTSVSLLGDKQYDAAEPRNSDRYRKNSGNNRYIYSNIHQWLNATKATEWYVAQHYADAAPDYSSQAGFLSGWSENHIAALDRATLTTSRANVDGGGTETFVARVALISTTELGLQSNTGGGRLDIFNSDGDRVAGPYYLARTPSPENPSGVYLVTSTGGLGGVLGGASNTYGVRPLCIPVSTALVSLEMDGDNCYVVQ